jgi:two-component system phosphate regulon response regulator PhoB
MLLDIALPGMSGIEFLRQMQQNERYRSIPVVFLTASSDDQTAQKALKAGAKGYLTKPFAPAAILESVQFFLE